MRGYSEKQKQTCQDLHLQARVLACSYYLRTNFVPLKLRRILAATTSLKQLEKYNPDWASQPHVPSGNPNGGQWTGGGGRGGESSTPLEPNNTDRFDIDKSVDHLNRNAKKRSIGLCARYVRQALQAGGVKLNYPYPRSAKSYGSYLEKYGFTSVKPRPSPKYAPQKGDIVVIQPYSTAHPHGHIAMYNGTRWVSDFFQRIGSIWPGLGYRQHKPSYEIYRQ